ncbi:MAG: TRIC cation channel family protein [Bacillota bacterium]|nr:TRIC cation channel family protein [Bacillota bacterium]
MITSILEIIGTIAFAVSGAVVGIRKKMDIFGVAMLAIITAVGGGIIRDVVIGVVPPTAFRNPIYTVIAIVVAIIAFLPFISKKIDLNHFIWILADSIGLGAFTIIGVSTGFAFDNLFLEVFLGVITGVGGGVIRDICSGDIPMIFLKHFYACPCIIGAIICAVLNRYNTDLAMVLGFIIILILRLLAAKYRWHLPKAK